MSPVAKKKPPKRRPLIAVESGQTYSYKPKTKGSHTKYVRIVRVSKHATSEGDQPRVSYRLVTRSGRLVAAKKSEPIQSWLTWDGKQWILPSFELVED